MEKMTTKLRRLLKEKDYLVAPCAYDALSARECRPVRVRGLRAPQRLFL